MKHSKIYIILFFSLVVLLVSCDDKSLSPTIQKDPDFSLTPMENEEAELAALHLSGKLIAPLPLYEQIKEELELIRGRRDVCRPQSCLIYKMDSSLRPL